MKTVELLLNISSNGGCINNEVDIPDNNEYTPLIYSCLIDNDYMRIELTRLLLKKGANPNLRDNNDNALMHLVINDHDIKLSKLFLEYGVDIDIRDCYGETPLMISSNFENINLVKLLLEYNANPNLKNFHGESIIEILDEEYLSEEKVNIISILLNNGLIVDFNNENQKMIIEKYRKNKMILSIKENFKKRINEIESKLEILKDFN